MIKNLSTHTKPTAVDYRVHLTPSIHPPQTNSTQGDKINSLARQSKRTIRFLARPTSACSRRTPARSASPPGRRLGDETHHKKTNKAPVNGEIHRARTEIHREHGQIGSRASQIREGPWRRGRERTAGNRVPSFFLIFVAPPTPRRARCRQL